MKVTELKLGDWILCQDKPVKVKGVEQHILFYTVEKDGRTVVLYTTSNQIKPIPLTKEILEKNGWHRDHSNILINNHYDQYSIGQHNGDWDFLCNEYVLCEIQYVHQLQHILWALGIDDNLKT